MKHLITLIAALSLTACEPPHPQCADHITVEGDYPEQRVRDAAGHACRIMLDKTDLTEADIDDLPPVTVRVYGAGESPEHCTHAPSGTCAARVGGGYHLDVRQQHDGRPSLTDDRVTHEVMHVLAYEMGVDGDDHHRWMLEQNVCSEMCTFEARL